MSSYLLTYRITILQNAQSVKFFKSEVKVWVTFLTRHVTFMFEEDCGENELESVQFKMRSEMPISQKRFQCSSGWRWPSLVLSRKIVSRFLFPRLSPPGDRWCVVIGLVPAGSVLSSSALQIFREASHLWGCTVFMDGSRTLLDSEAPPWLVFGDWAISVHYLRSCGFLFSWMRSLISDSVLPAGHSRQCFPKFFGRSVS